MTTTDRRSVTYASVHRRTDLLVVLMASLVVYLFQSIAWPLSPGRDCGTYLYYFWEMWRADALYPMLMLFRTPLTPLFHGLLLHAGGSLLDEGVMGLLFCVAAMIVYTLGSQWGRFCGLFAATALLLHPSYAVLFHTVSSDGVFAFAFIVWIAYVFHTSRCPTPRTFALHGVMVFLLVLIRPFAQFLLAFALFAWCSPQSTRSKRVACAAAFLGTLIPLLLLWAAYNQIRYGDFTVSRSSGAHIPLYRLFTVERLPLRAENGPASRKLIDAIRSDLLPREPYVSYGIDLDTFLTSGNQRMWGDLVSLSDRVWGWDSDYQVLRQAAMETLRGRPFPYFYGVAYSLSTVMIRNLVTAAPTRPRSEGAEPRPRNEKGLPAPTEAQLIPASYTYWLASTPDHRIQYDWRGFYATGELNIVNSNLRDHDEALRRQVDRMMALLPSRDGSPRVAAVLNLVTRIYPPMGLWLIVGGVGLLMRHDRRAFTLLFVCGLCLLGLGVTYSAITTTVEYRVPFDPLFILAGTVGGIELGTRAHGGSRN